VLNADALHLAEAYAQHSFWLVLKSTNFKYGTPRNIIELREARGGRSSTPPTVLLDVSQKTPDLVVVFSKTFM
jgi:hypothetical protein